MAVPFILDTDTAQDDCVAIIVSLLDPEADLRALTSMAVAGVMVTNDAGTCGGPSSCTVTVAGTTLEQPPAQPVGGGLNATLTVTLGSPLAAGSSVNVQFLLGVQTTGSFRFLIVSEALP